MHKNATSRDYIDDAPHVPCTTTSARCYTSSPDLEVNVGNPKSTKVKAPPSVLSTETSETSGKHSDYYCRLHRSRLAEWCIRKNPASQFSRRVSQGQKGSGPGCEGQLAGQQTKAEPLALKHWLGRSENGLQVVGLVSVGVGAGVPPLVGPGVGDTVPAVGVGAGVPPSVVGAGDGGIVPVGVGAGVPCWVRATVPVPVKQQVGTPGRDTTPFTGSPGAGLQQLVAGEGQQKRLPAPPPKM
jgi:hypothetical protein